MAERPRPKIKQSVILSIKPEAHPNLPNLRINQAKVIINRKQEGNVLNYCDGDCACSLI